MIPSIEDEHLDLKMTEKYHRLTSHGYTDTMKPDKAWITRKCQPGKIDNDKEILQRSWAKKSNNGVKFFFSGLHPRTENLNEMIIRVDLLFTSRTKASVLWELNQS